MWRGKLPGCCRKPFVDSPDRAAVTPANDATRRSLTGPQCLALVLLWAYKTAVSPMLASGCKFHPTCSAYAREAIERHGFARGSWMALKRLLRCRPFAPGGIDPVPETIDPADA